MFAEIKERSGDGPFCRGWYEEEEEEEEAKSFCLQLRAFHAFVTKFYFLFFVFLKVNIHGTLTLSFNYSFPLNFQQVRLT